MPDLSEFVGFVARKSGVNKPLLIEQDILIHRLLKILSASPLFGGKYIFKGRSCLIKCYYGYYRFSVDLDFTWKDQAYFKVGKSELQRRLKAETSSFGSVLQDAALELGLDYCNEEALRGGSAGDNAKILRELLDGAGGARREIVLLNAAGALLVSGAAGSLSEGLGLAQRSIDSGAARQKLKDLCRITNE